MLLILKQEENERRFGSTRALMPHNNSNAE